MNGTAAEQSLFVEKCALDTSLMFSTLGRTVNSGAAIAAAEGNVELRCRKAEWKIVDEGARRSAEEIYQRRQRRWLRRGETSNALEM